MLIEIDTISITRLNDGVKVNKQIDVGLHVLIRTRYNAALEKWSKFIWLEIGLGDDSMPFV
ncbi:hypothetical protein D9J35_09910 [Escherichia coli]|nr:hypothetical protein [Salmonella enterica]EAS6370558.1 hypothetical protein [Salmonella enterica]MDB0164140.1 hypothetical protein [Escherichia coli]MIA84448.1 hypothetical protein [Escherichia coli]RXP17929.1 hypothetical protein D9K52_07265 [Escherichia coli]